MHDNVTFILYSRTRHSSQTLCSSGRRFKPYLHVSTLIGAIPYQILHKPIYVFFSNNNVHVWFRCIMLFKFSVGSELIASSFGTSNSKVCHTMYLALLAVFAHTYREVVYQHCAEQLVSINRGSGRSAHAQVVIKML